MGIFLLNLSVGRWVGSY